MGTTPAREREQTCATEAEFERYAVKYAQGLDAAHLGYPLLTALSSMRVSYGGDTVQHNSLRPHTHTPVANSNSGNGNLRPETFETRRK